jgi:Ricin-type beta-trefoil lectin domain
MSTRSKFFSITTACISFAAISTAMASAAKADQIYVFHNSGMALNTNNSFSKIDGTPRMSLWSRNDNDPDQQFTELYSSQNRGVRFMHKSTGLCLNAHTLKDGGSVNLWNCDANDPDQSFTVQDLGGGKSFLKRAGTNFCVDSPTRNANGLIHLIQCNPSNFNQQWMISKRVIIDNQDGNTSYLPFDQGRSLRVDQGWQTSMSLK